MPHDDVFTMNLPGSDLVFTRYLFIKEEVRIALLSCILNSDDNALFWGYELFYSGFKYETFDLLWKIYYDFFHELNPSYECYMLKKYKDYIKENEDNQSIIIGSIISDFNIKKYSLDVFMMRMICDQIQAKTTVYHSDACKIIDLDTLICNMSSWISNNDYRSIMQWILLENNDIKNEDIYSVCLDEFGKFLKISKERNMKTFRSVMKLNVKKNEVLLSKIMSLFAMKENLKKGKSIYSDFELEEIEKYKTLKEKHNKILRVAYAECDGIDYYNHLCLFKLTRDKYNISEKYLNNWEYHASFSPIWIKRIRQFGGYQDFTKQKVIFKEEPDDEMMQEFYETHGLEPDEQPLDVQNKCISAIKKKYNWKLFHDKYKNKELFEAGEEELTKLKKSIY